MIESLSDAIAEIINKFNINEAFQLRDAELKALEGKLLKSHKMASIGQLAASVAHEINNPINGIINYAQLLLNQKELTEKQTDLAFRIKKEGSRIEKIVKSLLNYSRDTESQKKDNNLKSIVYEALTILDQSFRKDSIKIKFEWDNNFPLVNCNFQQIEQVLVNILRNAYQALSQNLPDNRQIIIRGEVLDCSLRLTIANNGPNIPPEMRELVLKPFTTTKDDSEGTGLGLSISGKIMKEHNGKLEIHSEVAGLTEMILVFPLGEKTCA